MHLNVFFTTLHPLAKKVTLNVSFSRTCLKRGYPWKSSWSSSDLSLTFNQREEENSAVVHPEQSCGPSVWLPRHPPPPPRYFPPISAFPSRLRPAAGCSVKTLTLNHSLINHKPEGPESAVLQRGWGDGSVGGVGFPNWHFSIFFNERWTRGRQKTQKQLGVADKTLQLQVSWLLYSLND